MAPHALGFVLIRASSGEALSAVDAIKDVDGVNTAYAVTGEYDIICLVEAEDVDGLASTVVDRIQQVLGQAMSQQPMAVARERGVIPDRVIDAQAHEPAEQQIVVETLH